MNVVILAAGKGTRMRSALPKVLQPVGGLPMLFHVIDAAKTLQAKQISCVIGHEAHQVQTALGLHYGADHEMNLVLQSPAHGTGHAVACALPSLGAAATTLILYGDVPLIPPHALKTLVACSEQHNGIAVLTTRLNNPTGYGRILRNAQQAIVGCVEEKDASDEQRQIQEVNTGIMAVPTAQLHRWVGQLKNDNAQGEYYLTDLLGLAARDGVAVVSADIESDLVQGVNSQEQRAQVERLYQLRLASELMAAGVQVADPNRIDIRGRLTAGSEVRIDVGCVFEGQVELGDHVQIGPNVVLKNVRIEAGARIEAMSHLEDCSVGPRATIGPFARIRPGSVLAEGSHVGNFTELKNTRLGPYSKANHLSYLGDAQIGARVNVGAGTITCNYDGAEKHRTVIEDDVFIGSDTQLVAPVVVHEGATLGAGTTLTADAPAHQLTLSRTRQTSVARWKRPKKQSH